MFASFGFADSRPVIIGVLVVFELIFTPYNMVGQRVTWWVRGLHGGSEG